MKNEKNSAAIIALAKAYEQGNTAITSRVESILIPDAQPLPIELQECLESWGKTPIEEPEYFEASKTAKIEDMKTIAMKELDIDLFDALDVATFTSRLYSQIIDKIDEDGKYKTTPNIDNVKLPRTTQLRKIKQMATDKVANEEILEEIFNIAGIEQESVSDWESDLIRDMMFGYIKAVDEDIMGRYSDRTPFARYIKNV